MDFLDNFNGIELFVILILGIILFGPEKLPSIAKKLGEYAQMAQSALSQFMTMLLNEEDELSSTVNEVKQSLEATNKTVNDVQQPIEEIINQVRSKSSLSSPTASAKKSDSVKGSPAPQESSNNTPSDQTDALNQRVHELEKMVRELRSELAAGETDKNV